MGNCQDNLKILESVSEDDGQAHLMAHWRNIPSQEKRRTFQQELNKVNVNKVLKIYKKSSYSHSSTEVQSEREEQYANIPDERITKLPQILIQKQEIQKIGLDALKKGETAVILMAGSQKQELGMENCLGIYDIGLDCACSLFEIFILKLSRLMSLADCSENNKTKVYIMTNSENKDEIKAHFKSKNYFGYGQNNIFFFSQNLEPVIDQFGKIVLKSEAKIYKSPRGNGQIYSQIKQKKLMQIFDRENVKYLCLCPLNNILLKICDPLMLGYLIKQQKQIVATTFQSKQQNFGYYRLDPDSKRVIIVEQKISKQQRKWANTCNCFMTTSFVKKVLNNQKLMSKLDQNLHDIARETQIYQAESNKKVTKKCLFFESFYHEVFQLTDKILILQVDQESEFFPIKSQIQGKYSILNARNALWNLHKKYVQKLNVQFEGQGHLQIHPSLTYAGENMQFFLKQKGIKDKIKLPQFLS